MWTIIHHNVAIVLSMKRSPDIKDTRISHGLKTFKFVLTDKCPSLLLPPKNNTVVKLLPSTNIILPRSLFFTHATNRGISAPKHYGPNPDANTLTPDGSITRHVVL